MDLDKLQVNACLRSGWQAVDLGFLMANAWWRRLFIAGLLPALALFVVLLILIPTEPFWILFAIWWLIPFWERLPLFIASRMLFAEKSDVLSNLRTLLFKDMLPWLLWRRFSPHRAFDAPVTVLEDLRGGKRRARLRVLHGKYSDVALANQFVCFCCEFVVAFGILLLLDFFTPESVSARFNDSFDQLTLGGEWFFTLAAFAAITLVMPFHAMAGFALYLNRRIELEAWDIEIAFRNIANRKRQGTRNAAGLALAVVLVAMLATAAPVPVEAVQGHDRDSAQQLIREVLQGEAFGQEKTVRRWRFKDRDDDESGDDTVPEWLIELIEWWERVFGRGEVLADFAAWLKIALVVVFVGGLLYLLKHYRGPLRPPERGAPDQAPPEVLFGLDVRPQSLPRDVPGQVQSMWNDGSYREALSLLYRASLTQLIDRHALAFRSSNTEAECVALVRERGIESLSAYFTRLTNLWRRVAYGHELPQDEDIEGLCDGWRQELTDAPR